MGGWAARQRLPPEELATRRQAEAAECSVNDQIVNDPDAAAEVLQKMQSKEVPSADFRRGSVQGPRHYVRSTGA